MNINAPQISDTASLAFLRFVEKAHGQVALKDGQVIFIPDVNFHGTATFKYTVTDQFGLSSVVTASIFVEAVNDAPITAGESATANEDNIQVFSASSLLANDWDEDGATDGDVLRISRVGQAEHGLMFLDASGDVPHKRYIFDSFLGNKYAGCRLNKTSKNDYRNKKPTNNDLFTLAA